MNGYRLMAKVIAYYTLLALVIWAALTMLPGLRDYLPVGGVEQIITKGDRGLALQGNEIPAAEVRGFAESMAWLAISILGSLLTSIPVSWIYMGIRTEEEYDQSLISTIIILPMVVTGVVVVVQNSLALAFSLAGIAGAVRFKNTLKSSGDALFVLLAVGIGLASGIGAVELAVMMSIAFNLCFLVLWIIEYGERYGMKRYMSDIDGHCPPPPGAIPPLPPAVPPTPPPVN
ncbi:DUF4956 domain-containing protein [Sphingomonas xanthus]|uniref:DUF4956 domain-containing protein n=1 Tax=Sphingomonas xanthus TaxID=2594473 RepID=A0A516IQ38_9SPHN|nr:DUF4956 domain-containing protein [Sphingomonas xanthus]QDP18989.1 hypothetical protein FMM02_02850 [Sphingomonas xanthus]